MNLNRHYPYLLIILSIVGLLASSILMNDTLKLAINPNVELPCNINPLLSCTNVASKWQSHVFGFPNPILGIISFSLLFGVGLALAYHVVEEDGKRKISKSRRYFWILVNYGSLASLLFVMWFIYQSVYDIGSLCLYCMIVWVVTWPLFLYTTIWNIKQEHFSLKRIHPKLDDLLQDHHLQILTVWYLIVTFLILFQFRDFFFG